MRVSFRSGGNSILVCLGLLLVLIAGSSISATAQQTNPVDRKVTNPMTDTPNVNPLAQDQPVVRKAKPGQQIGEATDVLKVDAGTQTVSGPENARVFVYEGNVDARIGTYRLQADKVTVYEATNKVVAEGNVLFDQGEQQRITGSSAEWTIESGYPNPSGPGQTVRIPVVLPNAGVSAMVDVVDAGGRRVRRIDLAGLAPGRQEVVWDGRNDFGRETAPGVYRAWIIAGGTRRSVGLLRTP